MWGIGRADLKQQITNQPSEGERAANAKYHSGECESNHLPGNEP